MILYTSEVVNLSQENRFSRTNPRWIAYRILLKLHHELGNSSLLLQDALSQIPAPEDRNFVTDLVLGTTRWRGRLIYLIEFFSKRQFHQLDPEILVILELGLYQLIFTQIAPHAAVDETVKLCKKARHSSAASFVNAVLRSAQRSLGTLPEPDPESDFAYYLSVKWSHPQWLVNRWLQRFGDSESTELLKANLQIPPLYIRANTLRTTVNQLVKYLQEEGVLVERSDTGAEVLRVMQGAPQQTESFRRGDFYIQDSAADKLSEFIRPSPEARILEVAAAPGGKTFQLALRMQDRGLIAAVDSEPSRMKLWKQNMLRMQLHSAYGVVADAGALPFLCKFDQVVLDAPCSSLGVIRRHPEIKWWRKESDLALLQSVQLQILGACAKYVRDKGDLFYIVCSFEPEETVQVIEKFVAVEPEFELQEKHYLYPHRDGTDGFFLAKCSRSQ
jgi:16S rRNA (cytosine967-C5)-methyltransferase